MLNLESKPTCFLDDTDIDSGFMELQKINDVISPLQCQDRCQQKTGCFSFVWNMANECYLKTGRIEDATRINRVNTISGPKVCGKMISFLEYLSMFLYLNENGQTLPLMKLCRKIKSKGYIITVLKKSTRFYEQDILFSIVFLIL